MGCACCVTYNSSVIVNNGSVNYDVTNDTISVSVDTSQEYVWEDLTDDECDPLDDQKLYMYGPAKSTVQITAYPFRGYQDYTMGMVCPVNVSVQLPWRFVYDCRGCYPCVDPLTGEPTGLQRRGRWVGVPGKKKTVQVTGDTEGLTIFSFGGCSTPITKFQLTAGQSSVIIPEPTYQYSQLEYFGQPIPFDTDNLKKPFRLSINSGDDCDGVPELSETKAYLTGFSFSFQPPSPPQVTYTFDGIPNLCGAC